jgi:hypothetical protein
VGFSTSGRLSSILEIKEDQDLRPVLTIICAGSPGYLRARVFDLYRRSEWRDLYERDPLFAERNTPLGLLHLVGRTRLFRLHDHEATKSMIVRHESSISDAIFAPLGVSSIEAPFEVLTHDVDDVLYPPSARSSTGYRIAYTTAAVAASDEYPMAAACPPPLIRASGTGGQGFCRLQHDGGESQRVVKYFRTYTYSLGLKVPLTRMP